MKIIKRVGIIFIISLILILLIPMPHGGSIGGNLIVSIINDIKKYFSPETTEIRKKEAARWKLQKEAAKKSWDKFEHENPQFFQK